MTYDVIPKRQQLTVMIWPRIMIRTRGLIPVARGLSATRTAAAVLYRPVATTALLFEKEGYATRNQKLNRPLSPSLGILAANPEPVWILSFGHRLSGSILTPAVSAISITYLVSGGTFSEYISSLSNMATAHPALWTSCKFMMALPFTYHCINGLRHLYWDTGRGLTTQFTIRAGYTVLVLALLSAFGLAMYTPGK